MNSYHYMRGGIEEAVEAAGAGQIQTLTADFGLLPIQLGRVCRGKGAASNERVVLHADLVDLLDGVLDVIKGDGLLELRERR